MTSKFKIKRIINGVEVQEEDLKNYCITNPSILKIVQNAIDRSVCETKKEA